MNAEREGFGSRENRKSNAGFDFDAKPLNTKELSQSGPTQSLPVVTGSGGANPGQNRDKSDAPFRPGPTVTWMSMCVPFLLGMAAMNSGGRNRSIGAMEREAKLKRTWDEIRQVVAEYHGRLPRAHAAAIGAAYARYSSHGQDSVVDQIRTILEDALRKNIFIPLEHIFFDLGVRGAKSQRPGLDGLRALLEKKGAQVVIPTF